MVMLKSSPLAVPQPVSYKASYLKKIAYIIALSRYIAQQEKISLTVQYAEITLLYIVRQLGPMLYYEAGLWKREISLKQKMRFLNSSQYKQRISELNPTIYRKLSNDKLVEKSILTLLGIPTARFVGFFHPFNGSDAAHNSLTNSEQLAQLLKSYIGKKLCFKLTEGWSGDGFVAVEVSELNGELNLSLLPAQDELVTVEDFCVQYLHKNYHNGFVIESYIEQHKVLAGFNDSSVNTLRMWLIQREDKVKLIGAVLRVGRKNQIVDNSMKGGILCLIDQETGQIRYGRTTAIIPATFDSHPDSGIQLSGVQLPFWSECIEIGKSCLRVFPHTNFVGLDMAFSTAGPLVVELNQEPDKVSARNFRQPLGDLLNDENIV